MHGLEKKKSIISIDLEKWLFAQHGARVEAPGLFWASMPGSMGHARLKGGHNLGRGTYIWKSSRAIRASSNGQSKFACFFFPASSLFQYPDVCCLYKNVFVPQSATVGSKHWTWPKTQLRGTKRCILLLLWHEFISRFVVSILLACFLDMERMPGDSNNPQTFL